MEKLSSGEFFGVTDHRLETDGLILTNTAYTHDYVDWHHHENAYFTFILSGRLVEGTKKGKIDVATGSLLYHNAQEPHYNIKPRGGTRGMHLEIPPHWMAQMYSHIPALEDRFEVCDHQTKILFYKILKESRAGGVMAPIAIQQLVVEVMDTIFPKPSSSNFRPLWLNRVTELLKDSYLHPPQLNEIAKVAGVHPVYLSRTFSKHFGCTIAEYIRQLRVARALSMLSIPNCSLSTIAFECGFADHSHMVRCFREAIGDTPSRFKKLLPHGNIG